MRVLVIPDVHLKPFMFDDADRIMRSEEYHPDLTVCLGDLVDDWNGQRNTDLYHETLQAAQDYTRKHPDTLWCYGNHDLAYLWRLGVSGMAESTVTFTTARQELYTLYHEIPLQNLAYVHCIDHVLFSHAGISRGFVQEQVCGNGIAYDNAARVIAGINDLSMTQIWLDDSPIWLRPQQRYCENPISMYKPRSYLQVVGHSPVDQITREANVLSCDVFSTYRDGRPIGTQEYCLLDTRTWEWQGIPTENVGR